MLQAVLNIPGLWDGDHYHVLPGIAIRWCLALHNKLSSAGERKHLIHLHTLSPVWRTQYIGYSPSPFLLTLFLWLSARPMAPKYYLWHRPLLNIRPIVFPSISCQIVHRQWNLTPADRKQAPFSAPSCVCFDSPEFLTKVKGASKPTPLFSYSPILPFHSHFPPSPHLNSLHLDIFCISHYSPTPNLII